MSLALQLETWPTPPRPEPTGLQCLTNLRCPRDRSGRMDPAAMSTDHAKDAFETKVTAAWPAADWRETHVLLAVSGGPDSAALLRAVHSLKQYAGGRGEVFVGHLN